METISTLFPIIASVVVAWGIWRTDRRWKDEKEFKENVTLDRIDREKKSMAAALQAEINGLNEIIQTRGYVEAQKKFLDDGNFGFHIPLRDRELLPIYTSYVSKIGLLGPEICRMLARHYTALHAILDENAYIGKIREDQGQEFDREDMEKRCRGQYELTKVLITIQLELIVALGEVNKESAQPAS